MYDSSSFGGALLRLCLRRPILFFAPLLLVPWLIGTYDNRNQVVPITPAGEACVLTEDMYPYACGGIPITFTFDDGYSSVYDTAFPIMKNIGDENGIKIPGTAYIITNEVALDDTRMTLSQITELANYGWEIGGHSMSHPDLTQLSTKDVRTQVCGAKARLEGWGFTALSMAVPYGNYNDDVINVISECYVANRTSEVGLNDIPLANPPYDLYRLKTVFFEGAMTLDEAKSWVDKAFSEGKWLILSFHRIADPSTLNQEAQLYNTSPADFEAIIRYVIEQAQAYDIRYADMHDLTPAPTVTP